jgi:peptidoglycan hydrolase-like protein with peptidoglycan-binding domain
VNAPLSSRAILTLQSTIGNRAVHRMVTSDASVPAVQRSAGATLSDDQAAKAVKYNASRGLSVDTIKQIQQIVGVNDDGVIGKATVRAIAAWQAQQGLTPDGKIGPATLAKLIPQQPAVEEAPASTATETETDTTPPTEEGGLIGSIVGGMSEMWDTLQEGAAGVWDSITDYFGGEETPAAPAPTEEQPAPPPAPEPSELDKLMLKERLSIEEIKRARELINEVTDEQKRGDLYEALQAKVEYHNQRDNQSTSGGSKIGDVMCNLTSLAMALSYLGVPNPDPSKQYEDALEDIRVEKKLPARTTSEGWGGVAKELGVTAEFLGYNLVKDKDWYMANVDPKLREGYAVMMSISGHIVRMQDVTEEGLIIDDPYGVVNLKSGEGWSYDSDKKNAKEAGVEGSNRGEDSLWKWDAVKVHNMRWIAALK